MKIETYPTRQFEANGFDESEEIRTGSGKQPFAYLNKRGDLIDRQWQRRLPTYGAAACYANLPIPYRVCSSKWMIVIRSTPCRINGVTADAKSLLLIPPDIEYEALQESGWEYGVDTEPEHLEALLTSRVQPDGVVAVSIDLQLNLQLQEMIRSELSGDEIEGGILAHALAPFDVAPEKFISRAREILACRARDAINARLDGSVCLSEVCRDLGVSLRTAERAFKLRFQETMVAYIKRARLTRARDLLMNGTPVTEAALEVGWTHLGRFSVEFKKRFGESPSVVQKRQKPEA